MRRIAASLIVALVCSPALAQSGPSLTQNFDAQQDALNVLNLSGGASGLDMSRMYGKSTLEEIEQRAVNFVNNMGAAGNSIANAHQDASGQQRARNSYVDDAASALLELRQSGQNLANIISADSVSHLGQRLGPDALQSVQNVANFHGTSGAIIQSGSNIANLTSASRSIGSASQDFPEGALQKIENSINLSPGSSVGRIDQSGVNMGNILISETVEDVMRAYSGEQKVVNVVDVGGNRFPSEVHQSGLNVANFVSAVNVRNLTQTSVGRQSVENYLTAGGERELKPGELSRISVRYSQSSANIVNLVQVRAHGGGQRSSTVAFEQNAQSPQSSVAVGGRSQVGNAAAIQR